MADNAIEKLFEKIRAAKVEHEEAVTAMRDAEDRLKNAKTRRVLLEKTLNKHIHEGLPVVQGKMQAHEEEADHSTMIYGGAIVSGSRLHAGNFSQLSKPD